MRTKAWLHFGMSKSEIRITILLIVISLTADSFSALFPTPRPWTLVVLGIAVLATVLMLVVLWKVVLRSALNSGTDISLPRGAKVEW